MAQRAAPPSTGKSIDTLLDEARSGLERLDAREAQSAMAKGALLIDIRSAAQRRADGVVPDALVVERNVLEWRCDPSCAAHDPRIHPDRALIVMCDEGYQSSLAAATLCELGLDGAGDLVGGFQAWRAAGLPVQPLSEETLMRAVECPCGHHLGAADDGELLRRARDHVDLEHPDIEHTDEQLRDRITADAYDIRITAGWEAP